MPKILVLPCGEWRLFLCKFHRHSLAYMTKFKGVSPYSLKKQSQYLRASTSQLVADVLLIFFNANLQDGVFDVVIVPPKILCFQTKCLFERTNS